MIRFWVASLRFSLRLSKTRSRLKDSCRSSTRNKYLEHSSRKGRKRIQRRMRANYSTSPTPCAAHLLGLRVETTTGNYATTKPQGDKLRQFVFCLLKLFELHVQLKPINPQSDRSRFPRHETPQSRVHSTRSCY
jgi:hypothetical protein